MVYDLDFVVFRIIMYSKTVSTAAWHTHDRSVSPFWATSPHGAQKLGGEGLGVLEDLAVWGEDARGRKQKAHYSL